MQLSFKTLSYYSPKRLYGVFAFLLTLFILIKRRKSLYGFKPLSPVALKNQIVVLGTSFVKLAQVLATRSDFFDAPYLEQLKELHDRLPPMPKEEFKKVYERSSLQQSFSSFDEEPIASASIGQVHIAYLPSGEKVAVKLRRFAIKEQVLADIRIISWFERIFRPLFSQQTKNSIEAVVSEFAKMIRKEVSLTQELRNLQEFSEVYKESGISFPKPYPQLCSDDALVMSFEDGFRFDDKEKLQTLGIDFREIIAKLVDFYTTQMLINGYFHADPHPGNLLVSQEGELILLDFGMLKRIPNETRVAMIRLIKAANEQDYEAYIQANKKLGTIAYDAPTAELAEFTQRMFSIFADDNLDSESMQKLAFEVLESTRDLPFKLPSDAIYVLRTSAIVEGLGTTYIENFNGVKDILPILQKNIPKALGAKETLFETLKEELKALPFTLKDLQTTLQKVSANELEVSLSKEQIQNIKEELTRESKKLHLGYASMGLGIFLLIISREYESIAVAIFTFGLLRLIIR